MLRVLSQISPLASLPLLRHFKRDETVNKGVLKILEVTVKSSTLIK